MNSKLILGVLAGVAAGTTLGLLFAPDSGENTRKKIAETGEDYLAELECRYEDLLNALTSRISQFKEEASVAMGQAESKVMDQKERMGSKLEETADNLSEYQQ